MSDDFKHPRVGIGVLILNEKGQVLLGLRHGSHGAGEWCLPGGHLEKGETFSQVIKREVKEETGLLVDSFELISLSEELRYLKSHGRHYVGLGFKAEHKGGEPQLLEPEKFKEWRWFNLDDLPKNLLEGTEFVIKNFKAGKIYQNN